jgi:formylglycine-generating enzyme required for sulfatase activity
MKAKLCGWLLVAALCWDVSKAVAQTVKLGIVKAPNQIVVSWPATVPNGILQSTTNLISPNWLAVSNVVPGTLTNTVQLNGGLLGQFFRLYIPTNMALIPAGSFTMGDVADANINGDAAPVNVYVSAFYLDQTDVTYGLWQTVYNWATNHGYNFDNAASGSAANHPVHTVDWYDCVKWCNARSEMVGLMPAYYTTAAQTTVFRTGDPGLANACVNWTAGYRLPTEAEWEKAARGGLSGQRFPWGATISESQANYYAGPGYYSYDLGPYKGWNTNFDTGSEPYTSPVGSFAANGYGLYDMAGNVWQYCWDWYGTPYAGSSDPRGPTSGTLRVVRGGGCGNGAINCRAANRFDDFPSDPAGTDNGYSVGFRSALPAGQ